MTTLQEYFRNLPEADLPLQAADGIMVLQNGIVKKISVNASTIGIFTDEGGSGKRFLLSLTFNGYADDGVTPLIALNGVEV